MNSEQEYPFTQDTYQTGSTCPPKSHGGVIAFLLVLVIFLCGVSTALGLMNIRLFHSLKEMTSQDTASVRFSDPQKETQAENVYFPLGFYGAEIPEFWCLYQNLPRGIYITDVAELSEAAKKGVLSGDILTSLDGTEITTAAQLTALLKRQKSQTVQVGLYRDGAQLTLQLTVDN